MALVQSKQIVAGYPVPTPVDAVGLVPITGEYVVPVGGQAVNDVIEFGGIPSGVIPVEFIEHHGAGGGTATLDWGLLTGTFGSKVQTRTGNTAEFASAASVVAAGVSRLAKPLLAVAQADDTIGWGAKVNGSALPAGMVIRATLLVRPAPVAMT